MSTVPPIAPALDFSTLASFKDVEPALQTGKSEGDPQAISHHPSPTSRGISARVDDVGAFVEVQLSPINGVVDIPHCTPITCIPKVVSLPSTTKPPPPPPVTFVQAFCRVFFCGTRRISEPNDTSNATSLTTASSFMMTSSTTKKGEPLFSSLATMVPSPSMSRAQQATFAPRLLGASPPWGSSASSGPWGSCGTRYGESVSSFRSSVPGATGSPIVDLPPTIWCISSSSIVGGGTKAAEGFSDSTNSTVMTAPNNLDALTLAPPPPLPHAPTLPPLPPPWGRASRLELIVVSPTATAEGSRFATAATLAAAANAPSVLTRIDTPSPAFTDVTRKARARYTTLLVPPPSLLSPGPDSSPSFSSHQWPPVSKGCMVPEHHRRENFMKGVGLEPCEIDGLESVLSPRGIISVRMRAAYLDAKAAAVAPPRYTLPNAITDPHDQQNQLAQPHEDVVSC